MDSIYGPAHMGGLETYGINHTLYDPVGIQVLMNNKVTHVAWVEIEVP